MNKILLGLNIILLVAVGALYLLYYNYTSSDTHKIQQADKQVANSFKIAYFDMDTLENYYDYSKEVRGYLMKEDSDIQNKLSQLRTKYNNKIKEFNQVGVAPTQAQQTAFQQQMTEMQTDYENQSTSYGQQMQAETMQKLQGVKVEIQKYLKDYCKEKGYAYVFGTKEYDDFMYYKDTLRNITQDIVKGLNEKYRNEKKQ